MNLDCKALNDSAGEGVMVKKPYETPRLQTYGGLGDVVRTVNGSKNSDNGGSGGGNGMNRTS